MTCTRARKIISLSRPGELSPHEETALRRHLASCNFCATEHAAYLGMHAFLKSMRRVVPEVDDPRVLEKQILDAIVRIPSQDPGGLLPAWIDGLFGAAAHPRVRTAILTAVCVVTGISLFVCGEMLVRVHALEMQLQAEGEASRSRTGDGAIMDQLNAPGVRRLLSDRGWSENPNALSKDVTASNSFTALLRLRGWMEERSFSSETLGPRFLSSKFMDALRNNIPKEFTHSPLSIHGS